MPLQDTRGVRKLIQLLDVIVLDIGPDHDDDDGDDGLPTHSHHGGNLSWCCLMMMMVIMIMVMRMVVIMPIENSYSSSIIDAIIS